VPDFFVLKKRVKNFGKIFGRNSYAFVANLDFYIKTGRKRQQRGLRQSRCFSANIEIMPPSGIGLMGIDKQGC